MACSLFRICVVVVVDARVEENSVSFQIFVKLSENFCRVSPNGMAGFYSKEPEQHVKRTKNPEEIHKTDDWRIIDSTDY